jgi:hypothetical protein
MEEILASIRRIIADDPSKPSHNDTSRSDGRQDEGGRIVVGRGDGARNRLFQNEGFSGDTPKPDVLVARIPQNDVAEPARILPQPDLTSSAQRAFAEPRPLGPLDRPFVAPAASPVPDPAMQHEELEAFLAELGSSTAEASAPPEAAGDQSSEPLPQPEFEVSDHQAQPEPTLEEVPAAADDEEEGQLEEAPRFPPGAMSQQVQPRLQSRAPGRDRFRQEEQAVEHERLDEALISARTTAAVNSAFNTLAQTVLVQNGRTLEDLVMEMLRPMLKSWLDDNLPGMVERLVRAEIERVSRGRG